MKNTFPSFSSLPTFLLLPSRFLLWGLLLYVCLETIASLYLQYIPDAEQYELNILLCVRVLELLAFVVLIQHFRVWDSLGLNTPNGMDLRILLLISAACVLSVAVLYVLLPAWFVYVALPPWLSGLGGLLLMVWIAPVVEELVFRGLLYRLLREQWGIGFSVVVSAVFFSLLHQGALISPQLAGGVIFALAYEWSRSLWVPIVLHIGANSAVYVLAVWAVG
ncbi:MAG: type II CAAX endopeptidase family protein [Mariprofundaceae bacterium]|nr:type II CAAX endopeptidase family protein [Mariprofundaceae bacterium]